MSAQTLEGGCFCGAVRYRITAAPLTTSICHCRSCRRAAGAQSVAWLVVARSAFSLSDSARTFRSSPGVERTFCPTCGTSLTYSHDSSRATIDVTTASLDEPERAAPAREIWLEDRLGWEPLDSTLPHFAQSARRTESA